MSGCDNCYFRGRTINGDGDPTSPFVIVGESAGAIEIHKGLPFQGPSGRLLKQVLVRNGFASLKGSFEDKDFELVWNKGIPEPFYTNAISCMPRQKDTERLAAACIRCRGRLITELEAHPRKLILALGNGALWSTTGNFDTKITKERGKLFKSEFSELGVIPTLHPSFMLRGSGNFKQWDADFQYAKDLLLKGIDGQKKPTSTKYTILENIYDVLWLAHELKCQAPGTIAAADIETTGFSFIDDKLLCIGIQFQKEHSYIIPVDLVIPQLFDNDIQWYWHNGKFDIKFLRHQHKCVKARVDGDTMLLSYTLNERGGIHDLDQASSDWLGSPNHKGMLDQYTKGFIVENGKKRRRHYGDVPRDVLYKYLAFDINDTYNLAIQLRNQVSQDSHDEKLYTKTLIPASEYLTRIETNGFLVDQEVVSRNEKEMGARLKTLEKRMIRVANYYGLNDLNPRSPIQLKEFMYSGKYIKGMGNMGLSTDDDTLKELPRLRRTKKQHVFVRLLREHRKVAKGYGTYVKPLKLENLHSDGRTHTTYLLHGTATGRLSSRGPNMQNIPRLPKLRGQFMARAGYGIIECDYSQAELRCLAHLSGCAALRAVFNNGLDLHVELSTFLFGENFTKEDKMKAKTVNFGIAYGREAASIAEAFKVSVAEAQGWIDGWFERFPGAAAFIKRSREAPANNETMITAFGNKKRPGVVTMDKLRDLMNEAANFPHQNIASNLTMHSGIKLIDSLAVELDTYLCNTVHDCLVGEVLGNWDHIKLVAEYITNEMQRTAIEWGFDSVPFKAEAEFGWRWGNLVKVDDIDKKFGGDIYAIPHYIPAH